MNKTASILFTLKVTLLVKPYAIVCSLALDKASWMSLTVFPGVRKAISFVNDKAVISGFCSSILLNILLRYIINRIGDIGDLCGTSEFVSFNKQVNPFITN
jgi:small basic protein